MRFRFLLFSVSLLTVRLASAQDDLTLQSSTDTWMSADAKRVVVRTMMPPANSEQEVRARVAGVLDTLFGGGMLLRPDSFEWSTFSELPSVTIVGRSYANFQKRECKIVILFSTKHTYMLHFFSPEGVQLPSLPAAIRFEGGPLAESQQAFAFLEPRMRDGIGELQKIIDQAIEVREKEK